MVMKKIILLSLTLAISIFLVSSLLTGCCQDWREGYYIAHDKSVGCTEHPPIETDITLELVDPDIIRLTAAPSRGGVYIGVIGARPYEFVDNSYYRVSGWFRKAGGHPEQIDINLQHIENYLEHYSEIIWSLNPESPLYQKVWTRNVSDEPIILFELKDDEEWHSFEMVVYHGETHFIKSIQVDDNYSKLNLPMGTLVKDYEKFFGILIETQNTYTNCDPNIHTLGESEWKDVELVTLP